MKSRHFLAPLSVSLALAMAGPALAQPATDQGAGTTLDGAAPVPGTPDVDSPSPVVSPLADDAGSADEPAASASVPVDSAWVGKTLVSADGDEVGTITAVLLDDQGAITTVRAHVGGFFGLFGREITLPAQSIILEQEDRVFAELSAEEIHNGEPG